MVSSFFLRGGRVYRRSDGQEIFPVFADILDYLFVPSVMPLGRLPYDCASVVHRMVFSRHPESVPLYNNRWKSYRHHQWPDSIWLFGNSGECLAYNEYLGLPWQEFTIFLKRDLNRLLSIQRTPRCFSLDLRLVWHLEPLAYTEVVLSGPLGILLTVAPDCLPDQSRQWWQQFLLPNFPEEGLLEVAPEELREQTSILEAAYASRMTGSLEPLRWNIDEIRRNLDKYPGFIHAMTLRRRRTEIRKRAGRPAALIATEGSNIVQLVPKGAPIPTVDTHASQ